jgi:hypothetical protein
VVNISHSRAFPPIPGRFPSHSRAFGLHKKKICEHKSLAPTTLFAPTHIFSACTKQYVVLTATLSPPS